MEETKPSFAEVAVAETGQINFLPHIIRANVKYFIEI